jgi:hypothetical protein
MSSADRSQTERIRRLRAQIQAVGLTDCQVANPTNPVAACPIQGPQRGTDYSTWLSLKFGKTAYLSQGPSGLVTKTSCCDPLPPR